jgi:hypothetical protein
MKLLREKIKQFYGTQFISTITHLNRAYFKSDNRRRILPMLLHKSSRNFCYIRHEDRVLLTYMNNILSRNRILKLFLAYMYHFNIIWVRSAWRNQRWANYSSHYWKLSYWKITDFFLSISVNTNNDMLSCTMHEMVFSPKRIDTTEQDDHM